MNDSRQVNYLAVYEFLVAYLGQPGIIPGTPRWAALDETDPRKWQAVMWSAIWWALAEDTRQANMAEASKAIAAASDWSATAQRLRQQSSAYIPREVA